MKTGNIKVGNLYHKKNSYNIAPELFDIYQSFMTEFSFMFP